MAKEYALKHNMAYVETSAKENIAVDEVFSKLAENILNKVIRNGDNVKNSKGVKLGVSLKKKSRCSR